jgi:6-pyruvoyltetrahydropterin/6-carboxytetrahydropterin synthase
MERFQSTKVIDGFSTCFRQWVAQDTHCKFLHGYAISFHVTFEGELDYRNWVVDFGFMKRSKTRIFGNQTVDEWFKHTFDHTVILSEDDPELNTFEMLNEKGLIQLRTLRKVGCEMFAKHVYDVLNAFLYKETDDRVRVVRVECFEHAKNSAIYLNS